MLDGPSSRARTNRVARKKGPLFVVKLKAQRRAIVANIRRNGISFGKISCFRFIKAWGWLASQPDCVEILICKVEIQTSESDYMFRVLNNYQPYFLMSLSLVAGILVCVMLK